MTRWLAIAAALLAPSLACAQQAAGADAVRRRRHPAQPQPPAGGRAVAVARQCALVYDAEKSRWAWLFASLKYGQVVSCFGPKWRSIFEVGCIFMDEPGIPKRVNRTGFSLLLPKS